MKDLKDYSLLRHNTFGIEARCHRFLEYGSVEEAQQVAAVLRESSLPYIIIGGGSNLLLTRDFEGIVVHAAVKGIKIIGSRMYCGSGEVWDDVVAYAVSRQLYGAENLSLIPGDVGASAVQNIGAYGVEVKDLITEVEAVEITTGETHIFQNAECAYAYRQSRFKHEWKNRYLITHVTYQMQTVFEPHLDYGNIRAELERQGINVPTAQQLRQTIIDIRNAKLPDPQVMGNAGSFFMNPIVSREKYEQLAETHEGMPHYTVDDTHEKIPAGWMIDQCGWKGKSMGRAGVHDKQALVLVNRGGATGQEIVSLCKAIQRDVKNKFGIEIHPEVNII
ncbi:MAG: UDP-N-acetylmuramate dehydrogenase [Prevotella sp.]|nr:UDP-N-acetylmuramate dehydrogenase [Prevotella sp.]